MCTAQTSQAVCRGCCLPPIWRAQDQVWLISTRHLPRTKFWSKRCCPTYRYYRFCPCHGWQPSSEREFLCSQRPHAMNTLYVHGNRCSQAEACQQGSVRLHASWRSHPRVAVRSATSSGRGPAESYRSRYAILRDVRVKYRRTIPQGYYLARWLARTECTGRLDLARLQLRRSDRAECPAATGGGVSWRTSVYRPRHAAATLSTAWSFGPPPPHATGWRVVTSTNAPCGACNVGWYSLILAIPCCDDFNARSAARIHPRWGWSGRHAVAANSARSMRPPSWAGPIRGDDTSMPAA